MEDTETTPAAPKTPPEAPPQTPSETNGKKCSGSGLGRIIGLISAVVLGIGSVMPWGENIAGTVNGLDGDGVITLGIAIIAIVLLLIKKVPLWIPLVLGVLAAAIGIIDLSNMSDVNQELGLELEGNPFAELAKVEVKAGLYVLIAGAIGLIIGPIVGYVKK